MLPPLRFDCGESINEVMLSVWFSSARINGNCGQIIQSSFNQTRVFMLLTV